MRKLSFALLALYAGALYPLFSTLHEEEHLAEHNAFERQHALICDGDGPVPDLRTEHQHFFHLSCDICQVHEVRKFSIFHPLATRDSFAPTILGFLVSAVTPKRAAPHFLLPPACGPPQA